MTTLALDRQTSLSIFERMLLIRHFEETVIRLYSEGRFASHYHIYIGQEATGSAVLEVLGDKDLICTTHRNHGHIIGRGSDPNRAMAEILGRATGFNGGRSGTLHLCDPSRGFLSTSAIVGGCPGLATGAGLRHQGQARAACVGRLLRRRRAGRRAGDRELQYRRAVEAAGGLCLREQCGRRHRPAAGRLSDRHHRHRQLHPPARRLRHSLPAGRRHRHDRGSRMPRPKRSPAAAPATARSSSRPSPRAGRAAARCGRSSRPSPISARPGSPSASAAPTPTGCAITTRCCAPRASCSPPVTSPATTCWRATRPRAHAWRRRRNTPSPARCPIRRPSPTMCSRKQGAK